MKKANPPADVSFEFPTPRLCFFLYAIFESTRPYYCHRRRCNNTQRCHHYNNNMYLYSMRLNPESVKFVQPRNGESGKLFVLFTKGKHVKRELQWLVCMF